MTLDDRQRRVVIESKGRTWGWQWRRNFGSRVVVPIASLLGRIQEEGPGAGLGTEYERTYKEVFLGDGLEFAVALKHVHERHQSFAMIHYVIPEPAKTKAAELGIHEQTYWQRRRAMCDAIAGVMDV